MNSWTSKITTSLTLLGACGLLNSCKLFGGGEYSDQTEIQTDVPESLEQGRASAGPRGSATYTSTESVPASSNLVETSENIPGVNEIAPLPGIRSTGGAPVASAPVTSNRDLIEIPKPDFGDVSVHNTRPPAQMITLGDPLPPSARMSNSKPSRIPNSALAKEALQSIGAPASGDSGPPAAVRIPSEAELTGAPKALSAASAADPVAPGVPLLHSGTRLSDFYASLHQPLLEGAVVENTAPPADDNALPPPPPEGTDAPPKP